MKDKKDYIEDISNIRNIMERSAKFKSLSGLSGILAGIYGLLAAILAYYLLNFKPDTIQYNISNISEMLILSLATLFLALSTAMILAYRNSKKRNEKTWNLSAKNLLINLSLPLTIGAIMVFYLHKNNMNGLIVPFTLIFYGMGIFNASKFSYSILASLGILECTLGLLSIFFISYSVLFWALGFGLLNIAFGIYIYYKYEIETLD